MNDPLGLAYVNTMAEVLGLSLDEPRARRVLAHLQRTAAMARLLEGAALAPHDELAEIYCPAPFPQDLAPGPVEGLGS